MTSSEGDGLERKNISITSRTYDKLKSLGEFGESFDELISRIADELLERKKSD